VKFAVQANGCILEKIMLLHFLQWKFDATILYSLFEWNGCYSRLSVFATAKWFLNTWLVLWKILDAVLVCYAAIMPKPTMLPFRCLLPFVSTYLCEQGWILVEVNEKQSPLVPLFSEIPRVYPLRVLHWVFSWLFPVIDRIYVEMTKHMKSGRS